MKQRNKPKPKAQHQKSLVEGLDRIAVPRHNLRTLAELLTCCGNRDGSPPPETIKAVGYMMLEELDRLQAEIGKLAQMKSDTGTLAEES